MTIEDDIGARRRSRERNTTAPHDLLVGGDTPPFARREGGTLVVLVPSYSTSRGVGIRGGNGALRVMGSLPALQVPEITGLLGAC